MWRSLFLALGVFSIILGLETMFVEQVAMTTVRRYPKFLSSKSGDIAIQNGANPVFDRPFSGNNPAPIFKTPSNTYGSQYPGTQSGAFNRLFGGSNSQPQNRPGFGLAGFSNKSVASDYEGGIASAIKSPTITADVPARTTTKRVIYTKDWMPWSLMAAGTVIVLYTYTLPRRRLESGE